MFWISLQFWALQRICDGNPQNGDRRLPQISLEECVNKTRSGHSDSAFPFALNSHLVWLGNKEIWTYGLWVLKLLFVKGRQESQYAYEVTLIPSGSFVIETSGDVEDCLHQEFLIFFNNTYTILSGPTFTGKNEIWFFLIESLLSNRKSSIHPKRTQFVVINFFLQYQFLRHSRKNIWIYYLQISIPNLMDHVFKLFWCTYKVKVGCLYVSLAVLGLL